MNTMLIESTGNFQSSQDIVAALVALCIEGLMEDQRTQEGAIDNNVLNYFME